MKTDITKLLSFFDEFLTTISDEKLGVFWFRTKCTNGLIVTFSFSIYEHSIDILITNAADIGIADISMENCSEIRILDEEKKQLEIIHEDSPGRCFLSLTGDSILIYSESEE